MTKPKDDKTDITPLFHKGDVTRFDHTLNWAAERIASCLPADSLDETYSITHDTVLNEDSPDGETLRA